MAEFTTNYNLKKPAVNDFYNVEDFNNNADIIDGEMKKIADLTDKKADKGDTGPIFAGTLSGGNYTGTIAELEELQVGQMVVMIPDAMATSGDMSLNLNGWGNKPLARVMSNSASSYDYSEFPSCIQAGKPVLLQYDGQRWVLVEHPKPALADAAGTLPVRNGGTGKTSFTANRLLYASATNAIGQVDSAPGSNSFLTGNPSQPPSWSSSAEVKENLGISELETDVEQLQSDQKTKAPLLEDIDTSKNSDFSPTLSDLGKTFYLSNSTDISVDLPANSEVPLPVGFNFFVRRWGTGGVAVKGKTSTVMVNGATDELVLGDQYISIVAIVKVTEDSWAVNGGLE